MAIVMTSLHFDFPSRSGFQQQQNRSINLGGVVRQVAVMLRSFEVHYNNGDHHVLQERMQLDIVGNNGGVVEVQATFLLRDGSGNIDDPYSGAMDAVIIADVV